MIRLRANHDTSLDIASVAQGLQWRGRWRLQLVSPVWRRWALRQCRQGGAPAASFQEALAAGLSSLHIQGHDIGCWRRLNGCTTHGSRWVHTSTDKRKTEGAILARASSW